MDSALVHAAMHDHTHTNVIGTCPAPCHLLLFCFCLHPIHSHPTAEANLPVKPPSLGSRLLSPASHGLSAPLSSRFNCQSWALLGMQQKWHSLGYHHPRRVGQGRGQQSTALCPDAALHQAREKGTRQGRRAPGMPGRLWPGEEQGKGSSHPISVLRFVTLIW